MPLTCNSASSPYATPQDYLDRVDVRLTGDLARDDNSRATPTALMTEPRLAKALAGASGQVEAFCLQGERYQPADLQALTGNSLELLKDIVCGLAIQRMRQGRGVMEDSTYPLYKDAKSWCAALASGAMIFAFTQTEQAGLPSTVPFTRSDRVRYQPGNFANNTRYFGRDRGDEGWGGNGGGGY